MGVENLLRIAGQVAGIGGLSICLFLLIARYILKTVPRPGSTPAKGYLKLIDKILLYAFILSTAGLMIYAGTKYIDLRNLVLENDQLRKRLAKIIDPILKENSAAFEVLSCEIVFDLTNWHEVPERLRTSKISKEITTNTRSIWRASRDANEFHGTYSTDSIFDPYIVSTADYPVTPIENYDKPQAGGKSSDRRWDLKYDVKDAPLFKAFTIVTTSTAWNARLDHREGTLIRIPTHTLTLMVKFPKDKLPHKNGFRRYTMPLDEQKPATEVADGKLTIARDLSWIKWDVPQPKLGYHYLIDWEW